MGDGFITFAFPPTVLRTAFGKPGILPRTKKVSTGQFFPRLRLGRPFESRLFVNKKVPQVGDGFITFAFPPTVLWTAFGKAGILPRTKKVSTGHFFPRARARGRPFESHLCTKKQHPRRGAAFLAERVGFEPTVGCPITSFQDWLLKPLGHLSGYRKTAETAVICGGVRGI